MEISADYSTSGESAAAVDGNLVARLEALLFVSPAPASLAQLSETLAVPADEIERALKTLAVERAQSGIRVQRHGGRVQLTSAPEFAAEVEAFLQLEATARLTRASLEILAIVAYREPVTRPVIDSIRGVNSETALTTLLRYGLVEEAGREEGPGRPILYSTTPEFLRHFGLEGVEQLPPLAPPEPSVAPEFADAEGGR
ncbi:MAG: SMC-Scp complex subunit ScpB [Anaerolineales bacterium]